MPLRTIPKIMAKLYIAHTGVEKIMLLVKDAKRYFFVIYSFIYNNLFYKYIIYYIYIIYIYIRLYIDYFSKYPIIHHLSHSTSCESIINKMKDTFFLFGIPAVIFTDNNPQFSAPLFATFANEWTFKNSTSSPHTPSLMVSLKDTFRLLQIYFF